MPTNTDKAIEKINAIYDKLTESECREVWLKTGNHLQELMAAFHKQKENELQELSDFKNQLSGTITK